MPDIALHAAYYPGIFDTAGPIPHAGPCMHMELHAITNM